jgi:hypothetical protein
MLLPLQAGTFDAKRAPTSLVPLSIGIGRACFPRQVIADVDMVAVLSTSKAVFWIVFS